MSDGRPGGRGRGGRACPPVPPGPRRLCDPGAGPRRGPWPAMKIVHVITRLILGGAQENTLLTVQDLHHLHHDEVTLITGPAEGPEGDLFARAAALGLKVEVKP